MVSELRSISQRFAARWEQPTVARHGGERKTVQNPVVGEITLDCDVLTVHGNDLRIVVCTAAPGDSRRRQAGWLNVVGAQDFSAPATNDRPSPTCGHPSPRSIDLSPRTSVT
jgi:hypothetical protein